MGAFITSSLIGREGLRLPEPSAALGKHQAPFSVDGTVVSLLQPHPHRSRGRQPALQSYLELYRGSQRRLFVWVCTLWTERDELLQLLQPSHLLCWHWLQLWGHSAYMHVREANPQSLTFVSNKLRKWQAGTFLLGVMFTWMIQLLCTECWWILHHHPGLHQLMIIFDKLFLATLQPHYCDLYLGRHGFPRSCFTTLKLCVLNNRLE